MNTQHLDAVYFLAHGGSHDFIYSLRSLEQNLPHRSVVTFGDVPRQLIGLDSVSVPRAGRSKYAQGWALMEQMCATDSLTENVILMNDDFFVTQPCPDLGWYHRGPLAEMRAHWEHRVHGDYPAGGLITAGILDRWGFSGANCYELHIPMVVNRALMAQIMHTVATITEYRPLHRRTLYAAIAQIEGAYMPDCKVYGVRESIPDLPFASTDNKTWYGLAGEQIRQMFPRPSRYELR